MREREGRKRLRGWEAGRKTEKERERKGGMGGRRERERERGRD